MWRWVFFPISLVLACHLTQAGAGERLARAAPAAPSVHQRHPVGLAVTAERLYIANHRSGTLSRIETATNTLLKEKQIGKSLSDLAILADGRLLFTDEKAHELVIAREQGDAIIIERRLQLPHSPVSIAVSTDARTASVASLWARQVTLLNVADDIEITKKVNLPFAPRMQCFLADGKQLVVADAFRGRIAVIDTRAGKLTTLRDVDAHNIRGLALGPSGEHLTVAHQQLISWVPTTENRISWGQVVSNLVRSVQVSELLDAPPIEHEDQPPKALGRWVLEPLGEHKKAAGDPGQIAFSESGHRVACLSGVHQVSIARDQFERSVRIPVGVRPTDVLMSDNGSVAYVANTFDDSISVIDVDNATVLQNVSLGRRPSLSLIDKGERLFYDANLSFDSWFSCHSCHTDGHTTGLLNDNFGDQQYGAPKRILSLLGTNDTGPWGWNGAQFWINNQVAKSIKTTMRHTETYGVFEAPVNELTDYLRSLEAPPSIIAARGEALDTPQIRRGKSIFASYDCDSCHASPVFTSERIVDVGLQDEAGQTEFNPPSLLGVSQREAWLHDNRAMRLRDVFEQHGHPNESTFDLTAAEVDDLVQLLRSL